MSTASRKDVLEGTAEAPPARRENGLSFRDYSLVADRNIFVFGAGLATVAGFAFSPVRLSLGAGGPAFPAAGLLQYLLVIPIITAWRATGPRSADISQTLWALGWVSLAVVGAAGRPPDYFAHAISDVLGITVLYFILSGTVMVRAIPALVWTAGDTFVLLTLRELPRSLIVGIIGVLVLANAFGAVIAWHRTALGREVFERWRSERELRLQVTTLEGLLRICAGCKRIKDESDEWQPVETFIASHSEAEFSHGLCPTCYQKKMDDIDRFMS